MKRFIFSLLIVAGTTVLLQVASYGLVFILREKQIDAHYTLRPDQKYLFLGSSQMGCAIIESPEFEDKVMWKASTPLQVSLFQLKELERRGQLKHVKTVGINVNTMSIKMATEQVEIERAYYRHLPVSLRYLGEYVSTWQLLVYSATTAHFPYITIKPTDNKPVGPKLKTVVERCSTERVDQMRKEMTHWGKTWGDVVRECPDVADRVVKCIGEMEEVCRRNNIHLVALEMPMPADFWADFSPEGKVLLDDIHKRIGGMGVEVWRSSTPRGYDEFVDQYHQSYDSALGFTKEVIGHLKSERYQ